MRPLNLPPGSEHARWTVKEQPPTGSRCLCECACGVIRWVYKAALTSGRSKSCGCLKREVASRLRRIHGRSYTPEYTVWQGMINRCHRPLHPAFRNYGARGISVCDEWRNEFARFFAHIGPRPSNKHSVDRIDNDGNYEPGNVRWATATQQAQNKHRRAIQEAA